MFCPFLSAVLLFYIELSINGRFSTLYLRVNSATYIYKSVLNI